MPDASRRCEVTIEEALPAEVWAEAIETDRWRERAGSRCVRRPDRREECEIASKEQVFGVPRPPTAEQLEAIRELAERLGDRAPTLREIPPETANEAQAILELYGRFA
jgi:hypothetical protein